MSWIEVTTHPPKPLAWWWKQYQLERVDMAPPYQRRSNLWGKWKKSHLIDSVINGFDVPKFYVADFNSMPAKSRLRESKSTYAVIDGKQRFEAFFAFLADKLPLNPTATFMSDKSVQIGGLKFSQIQRRYPRIAERLVNFVPVVMSVAADEEGLIEQLFVRLNSGVSINGAERRNAMPGPVPSIVRDVTVHKFFGERVRFSTDRMQEFNLAAKLLMFEFDGGFSDTKARNLDAFVTTAYKASLDLIEELDRKDTSLSRKAQLETEITKLYAPYRAAEERVLRNLDRLTRIFSERDKLLTKQGAVPVYYWVISRNKSWQRYFRDFLAWFEPEVMAAVREARVDPEAADPELLSYYSALRTSNDKQSMITRYQIISKRFVKWSKKQGVVLQAKDP